MACQSGHIATVYRLNSGVWNPVISLVDGSVNGERSSQECTTHNDGGIRRFRPGLRGETLEATFRYDEADAELMAILDSYDTGATLGLRWEMIPGTAGAKRWESLEAFVTSNPVEGNLEDVQTYTVTFQLSNTQITTQP